MKVPILNFEWLVGESTPSQDFIVLKDIPLTNSPIPSEVGSGTFQAWGLSLGATIYQASYKFSPSISGQLIPLAKVTASFGEPTLMVHTLKKGRVIHQDAISNKDLIFGDGIDLFRFATDIEVTPVMDSSQDIDMTSLIIGQSYLNELIGESLSDQLMKKLGLTKSPSVVVKNIPNYVNHSLQDCLKDEYTTELKRVWAQARILDFTSALTLFACNNSNNKSRKEKGEKDLVAAVHHYLTHLDGKLPTIDSLASQFGKSARTLNNQFQAEYGESIFNFVVNHRLDAAHEAIKNSSIPLKQIAIKLGYAHVNHFSAAFKKRFSYAPGSLRKR